MITHSHSASSDAIREQTAPSINRHIDRTTRGAMAEAEISACRIRVRLGELDREWNVDRALMLAFAIGTGVSSTLALRALARHGAIGGWGGLLYAQVAFLAYHAVKRWCPPLPLLRRLGFRSNEEIAAERCALLHQLAVLEA